MKYLIHSQSTLWFNANESAFAFTFTSLDSWFTLHTKDKTHTHIARQRICLNGGAVGVIITTLVIAISIKTVTFSGTWSRLIETSCTGHFSRAHFKLGQESGFTADWLPIDSRVEGRRRAFSWRPCGRTPGHTCSHWAISLYYTQNFHYINKLCQIIMINTNIHFRTHFSINENFCYSKDSSFDQILVYCECSQRLTAFWQSDQTVINKTDVWLRVSDIVCQTSLITSVCLENTRLWQTMSQNAY